MITGYSGFVSRHFLDLLESMLEPAEVLGVDVAEPEQEFKYEFVKCSFKKLNLLDKEAVQDVLHDFQPDYLLHLASFSSVAYSWKHPVDSFVNNTNIFLNIADVVRTSGLKCRILSVGSSEEYGHVTESELPITELSATKPKSPYAVARISQEMLSEIYAKSFAVDVVLTRSFNHIGPGQKDIFVISSFAHKLTTIKKDASLPKEMTVGNIDIIRDFVDVRDVVKAYYSLFQNGKKGEVYNICSGKGTSLEKVLTTMSEILDIKVKFNRDEALMRPDENLKIIGSHEKISSESGWQPTLSLRESLEDIINYWMQKK